jgi:hypothetical protein
MLPGLLYIVLLNSDTRFAELAFLNLELAEGDSWSKALAGSPPELLQKLLSDRRLGWYNKRLQSAGEAVKVSIHPYM